MLTDLQKQMAKAMSNSSEIGWVRDDCTNATSEQSKFSGHLRQPFIGDEDVCKVREAMIRAGFSNDEVAEVIASLTQT